MGLEELAAEASKDLRKQRGTAKNLMDFGSLKKALTIDPVTAERCFLCSVGGPYMAGAIRQVFGENNIASVEYLCSYFVVTLTDASKRDELLANVSRIFYESSSCTVFPLLPLPGQVTLSVRDIPQLLVITYKQEFLRTVSEIMPEWENLDAHYTVGNFCAEVTAAVPDIAVFKSCVPKNKPVHFRGFIGVLKYKKAGPLHDEKFNPEIKDERVSYRGY